MFCSSTVLPVRGGATIRARWPLPIGETMSMTRGGQVLAGRILDFELQPLVRIERRQIVEVDLVAGLFRVLEIDRVAFQQREIALALLRAANDALDRVAGAQAEAADLGGRDIDVVGSGKIIGVGRAQEGEAVLQDFDDALADDLDVQAGELLENGEHQFLLAHDRGVLDLVFLGEGEEFGRRFFLQVFEFHFPHRGTFRSGTLGLQLPPSRWCGGKRVGASEAASALSGPRPAAAGSGDPRPQDVRYDEWAFLLAAFVGTFNGFCAIRAKSTQLRLEGL